ncbi:MAG: exodeoxyribonuclease V subunit gamma [Clostridia bacterium]|nr:exodeoxyribonuclease V subunit gamma [Clostridia bacterium]
MLKLLCGISGAGKTAWLLERIREDIANGTRCVLLVPEQQAYTSERDLPSLLPSNAGLYFEIVHFSGLAEDVFRTYGGITKRSANTGLRTLLMWDTLRTLAPLLQQYKQNAKNDPSLCTRMLQTISELHNNGITGTMLEEVAKNLPQNALLQKKILDISMIDAVYHAKSEECFGNDPEDKLLRLAEMLRNHDYFQNSHIYVDSFTSFTAQEYQVLGEILRQASCVTVSLCMDPQNSKLPHFETVINTSKRLQKLANRVDTTTEKIALSAEHLRKPTELELLGREIWNFEGQRYTKKEASENTEEAVFLLRCKNLYEEAEAAALNILHLVQNGLHYGDIAVVARDCETYRGVLDAAMERYGIPYFLSERTDFSTKPLFRLILSALRAVCRHYPLQEVITLVKTGLAGVDLRECSLFEEYCETWHISGSRFLDDVWSMNPDGLTPEPSRRAVEILECANRVRKQVILPLQTLQIELNASPRLKDKCAALYHYLDRLDIARILSEGAKKELLSNAKRAAGETVRLYATLMDRLAELCTLLPNAEMNTEDFTVAIGLLFSSTDMGSVPNTHDCVIIGSANTLRVEKVRALLLLGLCEGEFPRAIADDGILSESDKDILEDLGIRLDSREQARFSEELLYLYRAMTKPTDALYLSTVSVDPDGSARSPSIAYNRTAFLLNKKERLFDRNAIRAQGALKGVTEEPQRQLPALAPMPAGKTLRLSQSKIQAFVLCPYRYYSTYRLKLREKKDSTPGYADDGTFLHFIFQKFLEASLDDGGRLAVPEAEEIEPLADKIILGYLETLCPIPPKEMDGPLLHLYTRLRKLALVMLEDMIAELKHSKFVPTRFEQVIGSSEEENRLPAVTLTLKDGSRVLLGGVIDRVDLYKNQDRVYVRVVDYKSGEHQFSLDDVATGMDIQLVLYLFAVLSSAPKIYAPAGAEYLYTKSEKGRTTVARSGLRLEDKEIYAALDSSEGGQFTKKLTPQTEEQIHVLTQRMQDAVCAVAQRILAGEADKTPSEKACRFCPVREHCDKAYHG